MNTTPRTFTQEQIELALKIVNAPTGYYSKETTQTAITILCLTLDRK